MKKRLIVYSILSIIFLIFIIKSSEALCQSNEGGICNFIECCAGLECKPDPTWTFISKCSKISCTPNWQCNTWSSCINQQQTRTCTDNNQCGTSCNNDPNCITTKTCTSTCEYGQTNPCTAANGCSGTQNCYLGSWTDCTSTLTKCPDGQCKTSCTPSGCTPNWQCYSWSSCINQQQTRTCYDTNNCGTITGKPAETQTCTPGGTPGGGTCAALGQNCEWAGPLINGKGQPTCCSGYCVNNICKSVVVGGEVCTDECDHDKYYDNAPYPGTKCGAFDGVYRCQFTQGGCYQWPLVNYCGDQYDDYGTSYTCFHGQCCKQSCVNQPCGTPNCGTCGTCPSDKMCYSGSKTNWIAQCACIPEIKCYNSTNIGYQNINCQWNYIQFCISGVCSNGQCSPCTSNEINLCNDKLNNDCDINNECDYDSSACSHGDSDCPVAITSISVSSTNPIANSVITVDCTSSIANVNSITATIDNTLCTWQSWINNIARFSCNVGSSGTKTVKCYVDTAKSYKTGTDQTKTITVLPSTCAEYTTTSSCETDSRCDWCTKCSGVKSTRIEGCVNTNTCPIPSCWKGDCNAQCDSTQGGCTLPYICNSNTCSCVCNPSTCSSLNKQCGTWPDGCGNNLNCGSCPSGQGCSNGQCSTPCSLSDAYFSKDNNNIITKAQEGDTVNLIVKADSNCNNKQITFTLKEYDFTKDDPVSINPQPAIYNNGQAKTIWVAEWQDDGLLGGDPEYYFKASDGFNNISSGTTSDRLLVVSKKSSDICGDNVCDHTIGEYCNNCESDCGSCIGNCGDGTCQEDESCLTCVADCGECSNNKTKCGDNVCDHKAPSNEYCNNCKSDCGFCKKDCGDDYCDPSETCANCNEDCGICKDCKLNCTANGVCEPNCAFNSKCVEDLDCKCSNYVIFGYSECTKDECSDGWDTNVYKNHGVNSGCCATPTCYPSECYLAWTCTPWSPCENGEKTRTCTLTGTLPQNCPTYGPDEKKSCLTEAEFPFFSPIQIIYVLLLLIGFYVYKLKRKH